MSGGSEIGKFQIRSVDSIGFPIRKNHLISQTYIANFKAAQKVIINLPWQFRLAKTIDIFLDNNMDYSVFEARIKTEAIPAYLFINGVKVANTGILNLTWNDILS
jgi:hypothetical protein